MYARTVSLFVGLMCVSVAPSARADGDFSHDKCSGVSDEPMMRQCCMCLCYFNEYELICFPVSCFGVPYEPPERVLGCECPPGYMAPEKCEAMSEHFPGPPIPPSQQRGSMTVEGVIAVEGTERGIAALPITLELDADGAAELTADLLAPGSLETPAVALQSFALARISLAARYGMVAVEERDILREGLVVYYESGAVDGNAVLQVQLADALTVVCDGSDELAKVLIEELAAEAEAALAGIQDAQVHAFVLDHLHAINGE